MDLLLKTGAVRAIGEKTLAVNNREQRIEEAPLRFAIRLQVGVAEFQFFAEGGALLARGEPFVVFLAEIRITGGTFDATGFFRRVWTRLRIASSIPGFAPRRADESGRAARNHKPFRRRFEGQRGVQAFVAFLPRTAVRVLPVFDGGKIIRKNAKDFVVGSAHGKHIGVCKQETELERLSLERRSGRESIFRAVPREFAP